MAEESKKITIEDLTKGMINYKYLCLDFEKAEEGRLRYVHEQMNSVCSGLFCLYCTLSIVLHSL